MVDMMYHLNTHQCTIHSDNVGSKTLGGLYACVWIEFWYMEGISAVFITKIFGMMTKSGFFFSC